MIEESTTATSEQTAAIGIRGLVITGLVIIGLFFGVFGSWAMLAPLESAAVAMGVVSVDSKRKTIQHLEGGIIEQINVKEGQTVAAGDVLLKLDETQPMASLALFEARYYSELAREARLKAERDNETEIAFPAVLLEQADNPTVQDALEGQQNIFRSRRDAIDGQTAIIQQRIAQIQEENKGLNALLANVSKRIELIQDEMDSNQELFEKGMTGKMRLRELEKELAEVMGERSQHTAAISRNKQNINEARLQITELKTTQLNEVAQELREAKDTLYDLQEKIRAATDILARTEVRAPIAGTVVDMQVTTVGGVIGPGEPLLDIVPTDDTLIIETQIDPKDIDVVVPGLMAQVSLTAFNQRNLRPIEGQVMTVSADRLTDERTGQDYFMARVVLSEDPADVHPDLSLYPGMQADVMIVTGARTTFEYLTQPLSRSLQRAFKEQ